MLLILLSSVLFTPSCSRQVQVSTINIDTLETFSRSGTEVLKNRWWTSFNDPEINQLVDTALSSNFSLGSAWYRLQAARAVVDRESASLFPDLEAYAQGEIREPESYFFQNETVELGLSASYEIDLWGRLRSGIEAEKYRAEASLFDYQAAAITLSAEVVRTRYQLAAIRKQARLLQQQLEVNKKMLSLMKDRLASGLLRAVDVLRQEQLYEATRQQLFDAEMQMQVLKHQLAVLCGYPPQRQTVSDTLSLPELPELPQTGLPAELLQRRPDVISAFNLLKATDRDLASAISNQYPRFSISASLATTAANPQNLFETWIRTFTAGIMAPLFYGGRLSAEVDRAQAVKYQYLYDYSQTVLLALKEVENALIREQKHKQQLESLEDQLALARKSYQQLRLEYFNGMSNYLDVLTSLEDLQRLQRQLISGRLVLVEYRVALYRALAGSYEAQWDKNPENENYGKKDIR